jgi:mono/diheme cytochrome c family protein
MSRAPVLACLLTGLLVAACDLSMSTQKRFNTMGAADFWPDGAAARPLPDGVVAQADAEQAATAPEVTPALLARGRERYEISCSPCHGLDGRGDGMVVRRGFPRPPSYHSERLRAAPPQHFVDVITNGYGVMYSYAARVPAQDRWAIVAYIRALQLSQQARLAEVPDAREKLP